MAALQQMILAAKIATPISLRSSTTASGGTISKPSGVVSGDILILVGSADTAAGVWTPPSGFTDMFGGGASTAGACYRIANGSEAASFNYLNGAGFINLVCLAFRDAAAVDVVGVANGAPASSSLAANAVTTTVPNCMLIAAFAANAGVTLNAISGMTQVANAGNPPVSAYYAIVAASGSTGTRTVTTGGGGADLVGGMVALRP